MNNSVKPLSETNYSFHWASGVYQAFTHKHARVQFFLEKFLGMSDGQVIAVIAKRPVEWRYLKEAAKQYERWAEKQQRLFPDVVADDLGLCKNSVKMVIAKTQGVECPQNLRKYIDKRISMYHL